MHDAKHCVGIYQYRISFAELVSAMASIKMTITSNGSTHDFRDWISRIVIDVVKLRAGSLKTVSTTNTFVNTS